jgi:predicted HTH domain antitoxin
MTLDLPDDPVLREFSPEALRLELACALYARGRIGKFRGAELAGVDFFAFQGALGERGIFSSSEEMNPVILVACMWSFLSRAEVSIGLPRLCAR